MRFHEGDNKVWLPKSYPFFIHSQAQITKLDFFTFQETVSGGIHGVTLSVRIPREGPRMLDRKEKDIAIDSL